MKKNVAVAKAMRNASGDQQPRVANPRQLTDTNRNSEAWTGDCASNAVPTGYTNPLANAMMPGLINRGVNAYDPTRDIRGRYSRNVALGHPSLQQSDSSLNGTVAHDSRNPITFTGNAAFHSAWSGTDAPPGGDGGRPSVRLVDLNGANRVPGQGARSPYSGSQFTGEGRTSARGSATAPNGSQSVRGDVCSNAVSNKAEVMHGVELMKATQRRMG